MKSHLKRLKNCHLLGQWGNAQNCFTTEWVQGLGPGLGAGTWVQVRPVPTLYGLGECQPSLSGLGPSGPEEELDCVLFLAVKPSAGPQIRLSTPGSLEWPQGDENHRSVHLLTHAPSVSPGPGSGFWMETDPGKGDKLKE